MNEFKKELISTEKVLKSYIKVEIVNKAKKLKGKYPPISEMIDGKPRILKVLNFYEMKDEFRNYFLIRVKNYNKKPKFRYFLTIRLASQSSDLLVSIAKDLIKGMKELKLIQFAIYPKNFRVSLLSLKEVQSKNDFLSSIKDLGDLRVNFRIKLEKIKKLVENK